MSPLLNAAQGSWSLSLQFKEDGSVVTWGDPAGADGFTVLAFHGWSKEDGSVVTWDKDHVDSDGLPFLSGEPLLQKEEMVKCPRASLDSASSGMASCSGSVSRSLPRI